MKFKHAHVKVELTIHFSNGKVPTALILFWDFHAYDDSQDFLTQKELMKKIEQRRLKRVQGHACVVDLKTLNMILTGVVFDNL